VAQVDLLPLASPHRKATVSHRADSAAVSLPTPGYPAAGWLSHLSPGVRHRAEARSGCLAFGYRSDTGNREHPRMDYPLSLAA